LPLRHPDGRDRLEGVAGYLMTDGYDGYNAVVATPGVERLACWAHVRAAGLLRPYGCSPRANAAKPMRR
jgi:transposase